MKFALTLTCLLLLTITVRDGGAAHGRPPRGLKIIDLLRKDTTTKSPEYGKDIGFNLEDALLEDPKKPEPPKKGVFGFNLEDALDSGHQIDLIQKLGEVIENQHQQIDMLKRLLARVNKK